MQKKIYITIDLPDEIKENFRKEESRWKNLHVFWTGFSHLRLTLDYLGVVDKGALNKIKGAFRETADEMKAFEIRLDRIVLGPNEKDPKMFWAMIFEDNAIKNFLKDFHWRLESDGFETKEKNFVPHIVLATAKGNQLKGKQTNIHIKGRFKVDHLNLYSSQTYSKDVVKFKLVESIPLAE